MKSERDEAQKSSEASAARVKELETAASRQKGHRKDDSKKAAKESKAANHRAEVCQFCPYPCMKKNNSALGDGPWRCAGLLRAAIAGLPSAILALGDVAWLAVHVNRR